MEDYPLEKVEPVEGETDPAVIKEKLVTGKYVLGQVDVDDNGKVLKDRIRYHAGDQITLVMEDGGGAAVRDPVPYQGEYPADEQKWSEFCLLHYGGCI